MSAQSRLPVRRFWHPRYWPLWAFWLGLHVTHRLPLHWQVAIGRRIGDVLYAGLRRERRAAARNLEICFPDKSPDEHGRLLREHFAAIGISFLEMGIGWFAPIARLRRLIRITGREHLDAALARGGPLLLWGAHFTTLEVGVAILEDLCDHCACMFRPQKNAMLDAMIRCGRSRFAVEQIPRDDVRRLLKHLKGNGVVVYFPDQTYLGNQSAMLSFFGEPALTNTATTKLAAMTGATVLTYFYRRRPDSTGYELEIGPPLRGIPSHDAVADAAKLFGALERFIELAPEQYFWTYKKFKRRPAPFSDPYQRT